MSAPDAFFTLDKAKAHLRVTHADEDALISVMLDAAVAMVESQTRRVLTSRSIDVMVDACDLHASSCACDPFGDSSWVFHAPLSPAGATVYRMLPGEPPEELDGTTDYTTSTRFGHSVVTVMNWGAIGTEGVIGKINWDANPQGDPPNDLYAAVMLHLGDLYENRESQVVGIAIAPNPTVERLMRSHVIEMHV